MAEEFQGGVCGGNWWNPSRNLFGSSPCSSAINDMSDFMGWPSHDLMIDTKGTTRSSDDSAGSSPQEVQNHQQPNGTMASIDSTLQMMGISLSSFSTTDEWNQDLLNDSARSEGNYSHIIHQENRLNSSMNYRQEIPTNFCEDSSINSFNQMNESFQQPNSLNSIATTSSIDCVPTSFPLNPDSYNYDNSPLLQTLFDSNPVSLGKPAVQSNLQVNSSLTPFWNATAASLTDVRSTFLPSNLQPQFINPSSINNNINSKPINHPNFTPKHHNERTGVGKKGSCSTEPAIKRPRIETPSPLPTFKVRKEKLGDRITALQQLVSPFGKTDTASVLHEAIEYIKFLHDQVSVLSTPYLKNGSSPLQRHNEAEKIKEQQEGMKQDLKSRGLCLVPISSTFPVASETITDFWTPTFGGSFR